jgi:bacteriorhodopsin
MSLVATVGPKILITSVYLGPIIAVMKDPVLIAQTLALTVLFITFASTLFVNPALSIIPGRAALAYYYSVNDRDNTELYRYTDWILTTPLMLIAILMNAKVEVTRIAGLILANSIMIWAGYKGTKSKDRDERRKWFVLGCLVLVPILWALSALKATAAITLTLIMWTLYPIVWLASEEFLITGKTATIAYAGMDVIAKVGLVYLLGA